ncbi:MAG: hypothetical protein Q9180_001404, partial [Flavoplaca navasiana]
ESGDAKAMQDEGTVITEEHSSGKVEEPITLLRHRWTGMISSEIVSDTEANGFAVGRRGVQYHGDYQEDK